MPTPITPAPITATGRLRKRLMFVMAAILTDGGLGGRGPGAGTLHRARSPRATLPCPMPTSRTAPPSPDDEDAGPSAAEAASHARALRGAAKLATDATTGLTDLVEAVHARIASVPGRPGPADERTRGITGLVYKTV